MAQLHVRPIDIHAKGSRKQINRLRWLLAHSEESEAVQEELDAFLRGRLHTDGPETVDEIFDDMSLAEYLETLQEIGAKLAEDVKGVVRPLTVWPSNSRPEVQAPALNGSST